MKIIITEEQLNNVIGKYKHSCDIFLDYTTAPDYDAILDKDPDRYLSTVFGGVVEMSPEEYLDRCAQIQDTSYEDQLNLIDDNKVNGLLKELNAGRKFNLPFINYTVNKKYGIKEFSQEGRHRVVAAKKYGCEKVKVALFYDMGSIDPYYRGWYEDKLDDEEISLNDMVGKWNDVFTDEDGKTYIEYDIIKDSNDFINLFPNFDEKDLLYEKTMYPWKKLNDDYDFHYNFDPETYRLSEQIPEYNQFLLKTLRKQITDDEFEEWFGYDKKKTEEFFNYPYPVYEEIISFFKYINDKTIYEYNKKMMNYIAGYEFYIGNFSYFITTDNNMFDVKLDEKNNKIRVYCNLSIGSYAYHYNTGKGYLSTEYKLITQDNPENFWNNNKIKTKYVKEYLKNKPLPL